MRISTTQLYTETNRNMMEGQSKLAEIQNKIASGKNFTTLADDPVGANRVVNLKRELARFEVYQTNINATRKRLELEEVTLDSLNNVVTRAQELLIQASNDTLSTADRNAISYELEELVGHAASLMNTRDAKGEYIFSGSKGATQTYIRSDDGTYSYQGDDTRRQIQVGSSQYLESTDTGRYLFEAISGEPTIDALGGDLTKSLSNVLTRFDITDADTFEAYMRTTGDLRLSVAEGVDGMYYSLNDSAGNPVEDSNGDMLSMIPYDASIPEQLMPTLELPGAQLELVLPDSLISYGSLNENINAVKVRVAGGGEDYFAGDPSLPEADIETFVSLYADPAGDATAAGGPFTVVVNYDADAETHNYTISNREGLTITSTDSNPLKFGPWSVELSSTPEDYQTEFTLRLKPAEEVTLRLVKPSANLLNALSDTVTAIRTLDVNQAEERTSLREQFGVGLTALSEVQERFSQSVASIGARINALESAEYNNRDFKLLTEGTLSAIEDLDYAAAATELSQRQLALEAAYASFAKIQGLSLFNYIN